MKYGIIGCLCLTVCACQVLPLTPFHVDTYADKDPVLLNVSMVDVISHVQTYNHLPHIENKLPITPNDVLQDWAHNRLRATNTLTPTVAELTVKKAYMTQTDTPSNKWYVFDNVTYRLDFDVMLQFKQNGHILYTQTATGWEEYAIPQKSSLYTKENTWEKMMNAMVEKVNNKIIPEIPPQFK